MQEVLSKRKSALVVGLILLVAGLDAGAVLARANTSAPKVEAQQS